jgi:hypothetical protein
MLTVAGYRCVDQQRGLYTATAAPDAAGVATDVPHSVTRLSFSDETPRHEGVWEEWMHRSRFSCSRRHLEANCQLQAPAALSLGKESTVPIGQEAGWTAQSVWTNSVTEGRILEPTACYINVDVCGECPMSPDSRPATS